jgi:predicted acylesterase/phospholipase RssA/CRP-like cAMP-binding protein
MRTSAFLRNVPVLAGLSDEMLEQVAGQVRELSFRAGAWVIREGDPAESLFIVRSGRLEVVIEGPPETLLRVLRRGDVLGELALLREGTRSASVRARRDVELLELGRDEFEMLIERAPSFALGLTRAMGAQLAASRAPVVAQTPPRSIAVVGLDPAAATAELAELLVGELVGHGSVVTLHEGELAAIDQAERENDRVVLRTGPKPDDPWTDVCLREAELVLALSSTGEPDRVWRDAVGALRGCELIAIGHQVSDGTLEELQPRQLHVIDGHRLPATVAALARRLTGRALGIVLSGGGARALTHLGVLDELRAAGLEFDRIAGVSLGSLVAAAAAAGFTTEGMREAFEHGFVRTNPSNDFVPPAYSLIRGVKARRLLEQSFGERRIEELPCRFFCVSCDLIGREPVVHRTGPLVDAVYASLAIPGVFPPVVTDDGRLLVDGGVIDNLPVAAMARGGEGAVIAVDVTGRMGQFKTSQRAIMTRVEAPVRRLLTGSEADIPRLGETIVRTVTVGSSDTVAAARIHADLVITPRVEDVGLLEWRALDKVYERGRAAAREALESDPELTSRLGI